MAGTRYVTSATLDHRTRSWIAAVRPWSQGRELPPLEHAALLVLDLQRFFAHPESHAYLPALEAVLPRILELVDGFSAAQRPVVYTRHGSQQSAHDRLMQRWWRDDLRRDEPRARLVDELQARSPDLLLDKSCYSAFQGTELEPWLKRRGCQTVVICGVMTHLCCETTARQAFMLDLAPVMAADACASADEDLHVGALRGLAHGFAVISTARQVTRKLGPGTEAETRAPCALEAPPPSVGDPCSTLCESRRALVVVGAGPAGLAAAIQARRAGIDPLLLDCGQAGGLARTAERVENYPGFPGGISGRELMGRFVAQAAGLGINPLAHEVEALQRGQEGLVLQLTGSQQALIATAVILATGTRARHLPLARGAVSRVDALAPSLRGQAVVVVGGGEAALDQALLARRRGARQVRVAIRGSRPRAMELLVRRCCRQGIQLDLETDLVDVREVGEGQLELELEHRKSHNRTDGEARGRERLQANALVVCIGREPRRPLLPHDLARDSVGDPQLDRLGRTSVDGLYLAGDACRGRHRQVSIAVGDGVAAAMDVVRYLKQRTWRS